MREILMEIASLFVEKLSKFLFAAIRLYGGFPMLPGNPICSSQTLWRCFHAAIACQKVPRECLI